MLFPGLHLSAVEGAGSPPATAPAPAVPASPAEGSVAAPPAASPQDGNIRQLREQYETTKREYEPYKNLGAKPEDLQRSHQTYQKIHTEATTLGQKLGYDAREVQDALAQDPVNTLAVLRQMAQQARGQEKPLTREEAQKIADERAREALKPFQLEREQAADAKAEQVFDGEVDRQLKTSFPNGLPEKNTEALRGLAWKLLEMNQSGYAALRGQGKVDAVQAAFQEAKTTLLELHAEWGEHEKTRTGTRPPAERTPTAKKAASIDDIIANLGNKDVPMEQVFTGR